VNDINFERGKDTIMKTEEFEQILSTVGKDLMNKFIELNNKQVEFINYCSGNANLLYIENHRFSEDEKSHSDSYKIKKALGKVLAIEYDEDISLARLPGTTETFHAVLALPIKAQRLIENINDLKSVIAEQMKLYVDERVKLHGQWTTVNKALLRSIGRSRANLKQVRRRLNNHADLYQRLSLSSTNSRPSYKKNKLEIIELLKKIKNEGAKDDIKLLDKYSDDTNFAYFYDKTYSVIDGNFRYKEAIYDDPTNEINKKFRTQKISSPVYIICEEPQKIDIEIIYRDKNKRQKKRVNNKNVILDEKILMTLPVFEYLN
jgi:hypothetical protein